MIAPIDLADLQAQRDDDQRGWRRARRRGRGAGSCSSATPFWPAASTAATIVTPSAMIGVTCAGSNACISVRASVSLRRRLAQRQLLIAHLDAGVLDARDQRARSARCRVFSSLDLGCASSRPPRAVSPLSSAPLWHGAQTPWPVGAEHRRRTASARRGCCGTRRSPCRRSAAWTLVANFCAKTAWQVPQTLATDADARRRRAVVAVAVVAGRRREIVALGERGVVDALLVVGELVGRQRRCRRAACSPPCARRRRGTLAQVAATLVGKTGDFASLTSRMPCAPWQLAQVATLRVARGQLLAVHARRVLGGLIDALPRREAAHQLGVAVAARAGRDHAPGRPACP